MKRMAEVKRKTNETDIKVSLNLDGTGLGTIATDIGFFDHLLDALRKHAQIDLSVQAKGDLFIDGHHTVEDVGIAIGQTLNEALGDRKKINRFGHAYCPLDEALARAVIDISGRGFLKLDFDMNPKMVGDFDSDLFEEFFRALVNNAKLTLHLSLLTGKNQHHALEAMMKAFAHALKMAIAIDEKQTGILSTKGVL